MITASMVKELRQKTGAGMMDCKRALTDADRDMEKALEVLREKGLSTAAKKAERVTAEGLVAAYITDDKKSGAVIELSCETDFVAANREFISLADSIARQAVMTSAEDVEEFINEKFIVDESITVKDAVTNLIAKLGENMCLKRFKRFSIENGIVSGYIHNGGRIGALVKLCCDSSSPFLEEAAKEIGMQIAAANPLFLCRKEIDKDLLEEIRQEFMTKAKLNGRPQNIIEKIVSGKLNKYYKEKCLLEQTWIKDEDIDISTYLNKISSKAGTDIKVADFTRFERGEDAEKEL